jgi:hypothetical protein
MGKNSLYAAARNGSLEIVELLASKHAEAGRHTVCS